MRISLPEAVQRLVNQLNDTIEVLNQRTADQDKIVGRLESLEARVKELEKDEGVVYAYPHDHPEHLCNSTCPRHPMNFGRR